MVRIRLKRMGRTHRPFYRISVMDARKARDGRSIEDIGYYDPMVADTSQRVSVKLERLDYWLGVGAQPRDKVAVRIERTGKPYQDSFNSLDSAAALLDRGASDRIEQEVGYLG